MENFWLLDILGTIVFAYTGAVVGKHSDYDYFGMLFLSFITAVGGGTVRDIIIDQPVFWLKNYQPFIIIILCTVLASKGWFDRFNFRKILFYLDTLGLGFFTVFGTYKAISFYHDFHACILMGLISGVLGGILRSLFNKEEPIIFKREVYATTSILTAVLFYLLYQSSLNLVLTVILCVLFCVVIRLLAVKYNINFSTLESDEK